MYRITVAWPCGCCVKTLDEPNVETARLLGDICLLSGAKSVEIEKVSK